jgi:hypothetical protein
MTILAAAALAAMNPLAFLTGSSHGAGTIKVIFKGTEPLHVFRHGSDDGRGGIILEQSVRQGNEPLSIRRLELRPTSATTLTGSLTPDAIGPVRGSASANELKLAYSMKGGLAALQTLALQQGGRVLLNHVIIKKFGLTVATIDEVITKD